MLNHPSPRPPAILSALFAGLTLLLAGGDARQLVLMRNTLLLAAGAAAVSVPLGTFLAFLLVRTDLPGRRTGMAVLAAMLLLPLYLHAAAWDAGFGQLGWHSLSRGMAASPWLRGWGAAVWVHAMAAIPWVVLIVGVAVRHVDPALEEEALLSGSTAQVFLYMTFPRMLDGVAVAAFWVLLSVATDMTVTDLYRVRTYAEELYTGFALGDEPLAAWWTALPGIAAGISLLTATWAVALAVAPALETPSRPALMYRLGRDRLSVLLLAVLLFGLVAGVPIGNLVYKAGLAVSHVADEPVRSWSPVQFIGIVAPCLWDYRDEIRWTLLVSGLAATAAVAGGAVLAWTARRGGWRAVPAFSVVAAGVALPSPLVGLAIIWLLDRPIPSLCVWAYDRTILAPVLAILIRVLPLAVVFCWFVLRSVSEDVLDAAATDGAGAWSRFWRIAVPQRWAGLLAAWLAVFAVATGDLACSILVVPPGVSTVPIRIFGLLHAGVDDQVAGICLTVTAWVALLVIAVHWLLAMHVNRYNRSHRPDRHPWHRFSGGRRRRS